MVERTTSQDPRGQGKQNKKKIREKMKTRSLLNALNLMEIFQGPRRKTPSPRILCKILHLTPGFLTRMDLNIV